MNAIGGYFELDLKKGNNIFHETPYAFKSGRSALHFILRLVTPSLVYVPYYTCNGLLEPFEAADITYKFYEINTALEPQDLPDLQEKEYFLYINYFDLKRNVVATLSDKYEDKLIVDCTPSYFVRGNGKSWFFNSSRKFFGVPDGCFLYSPETYPISPIFARNENYIVDHLIKRFNGHAREGYPSFQKNEILCGPEITGISKLSECILSNIDYKQASEIRRSNFSYLHSILDDTNLLRIELDEESVPMYYPFLKEKSLNKNLLYEKDIFIPTLWKDVLNRNIAGFDWEKTISKNLLPLPIDHRYDKDDMEKMVNIIISLQQCI